MLRRFFVLSAMHSVRKTRRAWSMSCGRRARWCCRWWLSLMARSWGTCMFSPMTIESGIAHLPPSAWRRSRSRRRISGRVSAGELIEAGLAELRAAGHGAVFLLGHPSYYPRFGFRPAREFGVHYEDDRDAFMAIELLSRRARAGCRGRALRAGVRGGYLGIEGLFDFGGVLREAVGEGAKHAEAAAEHHVAMGRGEVGLEPGCGGGGRAGGR